MGVVYYIRINRRTDACAYAGMTMMTRRTWTCKRSASITIRPMTNKIEGRARDRDRDRDRDREDMDLQEIRLYYYPADDQ